MAVSAAMRKALNRLQCPPEKVEALQVEPKPKPKASKPKPVAQPVAEPQ